MEYRRPLPIKTDKRSQSLMRSILDILLCETFEKYARLWFLQFFEEISKFSDSLHIKWFSICNTSSKKKNLFDCLIFGKYSITMYFFPYRYCHFSDQIWLSSIILIQDDWIDLFFIFLWQNNRNKSPFIFDKAEWKVFTATEFSGYYVLG